MLDKIPVPPHFSIDEVTEVVEKYYNINADAKTLDSYMDQNFLLIDKTGKKYILKIANQSETWDNLDAQNKAMEYLKEKEWPYLCQVPLPTKSGSKIAQIKGSDEKLYYVRMLPFLKGDFLVNVKSFTSELLYKLGHFVGQMDQVLMEFSHIGAHRDLIWDLKNVLLVKDYLSHIQNPELRRIMDYFILQFETNVLPILSHLRKSVIHNDANDYNIIVKKNVDDRYEISGIIDFGDMVSTYTICELAITLSYAMLDKENPIEAAADVIRGYYAAFPIGEQELDILFYFVCARLCTSVVMSAYRKKKNPENEYLNVSERPVWALLEKLLSINPIRIKNIFRQACGFQPIQGGLSKNHIIKSRQKTIGKSLSISYNKPLKIVQGAFQYLFDDEGNTYLDAVNNVPHVGHSHPKVVRAAQKQVSILNTNTRYLHDYLVEYAHKLTLTMPNPLSVCYFVCSGSEANDLALRMARTKTGQIDTIVVDGAYHGTTIADIELSPYKFDGPGGQGTAKHIHKVPMPDIYRGIYRSDDPQAGRKYAYYVQNEIEQIQKEGNNINAFVCESILGCGGQIVLPDNYLKEAYAYVRNAGGVCIADEVQVGFGRVGMHMWAFETQGVVPDIVTLGKPIGSGHPLAAVVTTPEIAEAFTTGMEYFNTYGGNPVSCAVGLAVLEVVKEEGLQEHALQVGNYLKSGLKDLMSKHQIIGDVRGLGLFIGIELVRDRETLEPAAEEATQVIEQMKDHGILISTDGPLHNVLKIKPPLVFNKENAKFFVQTLDQILTEL